MIMLMYEPEHWVDFGVGLIGASAALLGLLFVAMSINLDHILKHTILPRLAGSVLILLVLPVMVALVLMVPGQTAKQCGIGLIAIGAVGFLLLLPTMLTQAVEHSAWWLWALLKVAPDTIASVSLVTAGASLLLGRGGGLYWMVLGVAAAYLAGLLGSWVLLVEIQR